VIRASRRLLVASALLSASPPAHAVEVQFEGWYRARMRLFDTLSLDRTLSDSEGVAWYAQHRLFLEPKFLVTDDVSAFAQFRGLDGVYWGDQPTGLVSPVLTAPPSYDTGGLTAPTSTTDPSDALRDFTLWRAWGEAQTPIGRFSFGRMPLNWGQGIWLNDGLCQSCDYGDTTDRIRWEYLVQDQVWLSLAADIDSEGFVNDTDDTTSFDATFAYRNEQIDTGLWASWSHTPSREFNLFSLDGSFSVQLGKLSADTEVVGQFGGGTLPDGVSDVQITALGAVLDAKADLEPWILHAEGGFASGDGDDRDNQLKVFTFDRDHSVGLMMFEQPMPTLAAAVANEANGGRSTDVALTGDAISNALYLKPTIGRELVDGLSLEQSWLGARAAKVPDSFGSRRSYGMEFDTTLKYTGVEHFTAAATFAAFIPGTYYRDYTDPTYDSFDQSAFGGQLMLMVDF
jgi:hypothetical protein